MSYACGNKSPNIPNQKTTGATANYRVECQVLLLLLLGIITKTLGLPEPPPERTGVLANGKAPQGRQRRSRTEFGYLSRNHKSLRQLVGNVNELRQTAIARYTRQSHEIQGHPRGQLTIQNFYSDMQAPNLICVCRIYGEEKQERLQRNTLAELLINTYTGVSNLLNMSSHYVSKSLLNRRPNSIESALKMSSNYANKSPSNHKINSIESILDMSSNCANKLPSNDKTNPTESTLDMSSNYRKKNAIQT